jgi:hypothetical protein
MWFMSFRAARTIALLLLLICGASARADRCFVVVFGAVAQPMRPKLSHSWATFVRMPAAGGSPEITTISWLPAKGEITPLSLSPEPGYNYSLDETFAGVLSQGQKVWAWGPYEIQPALYIRAMCHKLRLDCGEVQYKMVHWFRNSACVNNCVHALTSFNDAEPWNGDLNYGPVASYYVAKNYLQWTADQGCVHPWVADLLCLGAYPIHWRNIQDGRPWPRLERHSQ